MVRGRFIYDKSKGKMVPYSEYRAPDSSNKSKVTIMTDEIPETWHPADGRYYTSKKKFREVTREHGCIEVGNDPAIYRALEKKEERPVVDAELRQELAERLK